MTYIDDLLRDLMYNAEAAWTLTGKLQVTVQDIKIMKREHWLEQLELAVDTAQRIISHIEDLVQEIEMVEDELEAEK